MGNLLRDQNGNIKIPKTKIEVTIRPSNYDLNFKQIQERVFNTLNHEWGQAGFELEFVEYTRNHQINEDYYRRTFNSWRTPCQERGCYIDFNQFELGAAFQQVIPRDAFADTSDYISIDKTGRANLLRSDVVHEFGHALGLAHEHQRIDRANFIVPQNRNQYNQGIREGQQIGIQNRSVPFGWYDFGSVMHYPGVFEVNPRFNPRWNIGGTNDNPQFFEIPSGDDLMTARFLYNEARIKEELDKQQQRIKYEDNNRRQGIVESISPFSKSKISLNQYGVNFFKNEQNSRLKALADTGNNSFAATINRTYHAVVSQWKQLKSLKLDIEALDIQLMQKSELNYNRINNIQNQRIGNSRTFK